MASHFSLLNGDVDHFMDSIYITDGKNMRPAGFHFGIYTDVAFLRFDAYSFKIEAINIWPAS